jgi:hypothetical protein
LSELKDGETLFSKMAQQGQGITFDNLGHPLVYQEAKNTNQIIDNLDFKL